MAGEPPAPDRLRGARRALLPAAQNGIYAVVPMLLASAFTVSEKRLRRPVLAVLLAVCIGSFGFDTFTEKVLDIPAGSVGEALSIPMQQTARYIRDYGNEVTDDERTAIEKVLDYDAIVQSYMPELSDGVKQYYKIPVRVTWPAICWSGPKCCSSTRSAILRQRTQTPTGITPSRNAAPSTITTRSIMTFAWKCLK